MCDRHTAGTGMLSTLSRWEVLYDQQVLDHLNEHMCEFISRQEMFSSVRPTSSANATAHFAPATSGCFFSISFAT
jgi:hypothetical protein